MTLIFSAMGPKLGLVALSDVLTSTRALEFSTPVLLPVRREAAKWGNGTNFSAGVAQKTSIFGRTMVQWAGPVTAASDIIRSLRKVSRNGAIKVSLNDVISSASLSDTTLRNMQMIYHYRENDETCIRTHFQCQEFRYGENLVIVGGSGTNDFLFDTYFTDPLKSDPLTDFVREIFSRANGVFLTSIFGDDSFEDAYGGWLEFATATSRGFRKVAVSVKVWQKADKGSLFAYGPIILSRYVGANLVIAKVFFNQSDPKINPPEILFAGVPDFLRRLVDPKDVPTDISVQDGIMLHIVHQEDETFRSLLLQYPDRPGIKFQNNGRDLHFSFEGWLTERLISLGDKPTAELDLR